MQTISLTKETEEREKKEHKNIDKIRSWENVSASGITEWPRRIEME
jgi:hypothetical protein